MEDGIGRVYGLNKIQAREIMEFNEGVKQPPLAPREESQQDSDWQQWQEEWHCEQWQEDYWDHWQ